MKRMLTALTALALVGCGMDTSKLDEQKAKDKDKAKTPAAERTTGDTPEAAAPATASGPATASSTTAQGGTDNNNNAVNVNIANVVNNADGGTTARATNITTTGNAASTPKGKTDQAGVYTPDGRFLYVANHTDDLIDAYAVDKDDGQLTNIGFANAGKDVRTMATSPNNANLYAASFDGDSITVFQIHLDGTIDSVQTVHVDHPASISIDTDGKILTVDGNTYKILASGKLKE